MTEEQQTQQDDIGETLKQAAELFAKAASDVENRDKVLKEVEKTLSKIKLTDAPTLAESPIVQAFVKAMGLGDLAPGQTRAAGTLAERSRDWSWGDTQQMERRRFVARESGNITWNGLSVHVEGGEEYNLPWPFYEEWRRSEYAKRQGVLHERWMLNQPGPPPDANWIADESARVRATTLLGVRDGRPGGTIGVGPISDFEEPGEAPNPVRGEKSA